MKLPCESSTHLMMMVPATNATQMMFVWRNTTATAPLCPQHDDEQQHDVSCSHSNSALNTQANGPSDHHNAYAPPRTRTHQSAEHEAAACGRVQQQVHALREEVHEQHEERRAGVRVEEECEEEVHRKGDHHECVAAAVAVAGLRPSQCASDVALPHDERPPPSTTVVEHRTDVSGRSLVTSSALPTAKSTLTLRSTAGEQKPAPKSAATCA